MTTPADSGPTPQGERLTNHERRKAAWAWPAVTALLTVFLVSHRVVHSDQPMDIGITVVLVLALLTALLSVLAFVQLVLPEAEVTLVGESIAPGSEVEIQWRFPKRARWVRSVRLRLEEREVPTVPGTEVSVVVVRSTPLVAVESPAAQAGRVAVSIPKPKETWRGSLRKEHGYVTFWAVRMDVRCGLGMTVLDRFDLC